MKTIKAILVDDEEGARDVLANLLLRFCPNVELLAKCSNIPEAVEQIKSLQPDLVFLDIEMPNYAGYEIVNFFEKIDFEIVFVTAYDQYAIRAFEIAALDYLLKPIDIERLKLAVERVLIYSNKKLQEQRLQVLQESMSTKTLSNIIVAFPPVQIFTLAGVTV
jgi:two-component system LytT family response regulator